MQSDDSRQVGNGVSSHCVVDAGIHAAKGDVPVARESDRVGGCAEPLVNAGMGEELTGGDILRREAVLSLEALNVTRSAEADAG